MWVCVGWEGIDRTQVIMKARVRVGKESKGERKEKQIGLDWKGRRYG